MQLNVRNAWLTQKDRNIERFNMKFERKKKIKKGEFDVYERDEFVIGDT